MIHNSYRMWAILAVTGVALSLSITFAFAADCSGNVQVTGGYFCTESRACDIAKNPNCSNKIVAFNNLSTCTSTGAVAADNCVISTTDRDCAQRTACTKNPSGTACISGSDIGKATDKEPIDGGACSIPGG
jgi:hypothetical protein